MALLKKGYGDGRLSLKSLGKAFEEAKGKIKIYDYAEYEGGRTKEILLPFEGIVERMKGCEGLYEGGLSLLKQDAKLNLEFLDHNSYCHKGKSDEISFRSFRRALTLLEYCYRACAFLFDPEGWESFVYSTEEEEDEFDRKLDEEYHSKFRVNVRYVCSGREAFTKPDQQSKMRPKVEKSRAAGARIRPYFMKEAKEKLTPCFLRIDIHMMPAKAPIGVR